MNLLEQVSEALAKNKEHWAAICKETNTSIAWVSQVARGAYTSSPSYDRLMRVQGWLAKNGKKLKRAA